MKAKQPYLLRALYEWIVDSDLTPYLLVEVTDDAVRVPEQYVQDGRIVLNISPSAVRGLDVGEAWLSFEGRFAGRPFLVEVPQRAIRAIYAKENGDGMMFDPTELADQSQDSGTSAPAEERLQDSSATDEKSANHLKVVK